MSLFGGKPPTLPQNDPNPARRQSAIAKQRNSYVFDDGYHGIVLSASLPLLENYSPAYLTRIAELKTALWRNNAARDAWATAQQAAPVETSQKGLLGALYAHLDAIAETVEGALVSAREKVYGTVPLTRPTSFAEYMNVYGNTIPSWASAWWREDWFFAYQRLGGGGPVAVKRATALPDNFPLTEAQYARATGSSDTLAAALATGRLYLADYAILDGYTAGQSGPFPKRTCAPIAAFAWSPGAAKYAFVPIAIQCGQAPGPQTPIFTPADGMRWQQAKTVVQSADATYQTVVAHWTWSHCVMESITLSLYRELSEQHPLFRLLSPHCQFTLAANDTMKSTILNPGGYAETLQGGTLEATLDLMNRGMKALSFASLNPVSDFAERGVSDTEALPDYPFRDDGTLIWDAVRAWVDGYLRLYYTSDADVAGDAELSEFMETLGAADGGHIDGVPQLTTVDALVDAAASIIYRASAYHAALNYSAGDYLGYAPNAPSALYGPGPDAKSEATEADLLFMMPPLSVANDAYNLPQATDIRMNKLGEYAGGHFGDDRVTPLLAAFNKQLLLAAETMGQRNGGRPVPYRYLLPSWITASTHA